MTSRSSGRTRAVAAAVALVGSVLLAGCGDRPTVEIDWTPSASVEPLPSVPDDEGSIPDPGLGPTGTDVAPGPTGSDPVGPVIATEAEVLQAYRDASAVAGEAFASPQQGMPLLESRYVDPLLGRLRKVMTDLVDRGIAVRFENGLPPQVRLVSSSIGPDRAMLRLCVLDNAVQVKVADGSVVDDTQISSLRDVTMVIVDGNWKVSDESIVSEKPGLGGC